MARPRTLRTAASHPCRTPAGLAVLDAHPPADGESPGAAWERAVRDALTGRTREAAAGVLGVHVRTVQRWREWLDARGGAPVGAVDHEARGPGSRGGVSPATERARRRAGVNGGNSMT